MSRVIVRELLALNTATNTTILSSMMMNNSTSNNNNNNNNTELWKSPIPYLFGSLALMLLLIATALILLLLSYRRQYYSSRLATGQAGQLADEAKWSSEKPSDEQIVVIMAGDERPTQIATPVVVTIAMPTANVCSCGGGAGQHTMVKL